MIEESRSSRRAARRPTSRRGGTGRLPTTAAQVADFNGPDYTPRCGPGCAIDLSQGTGWGSTTGDDEGTPTGEMIPKFIEIGCRDDRRHVVRRQPVEHLWRPGEQLDRRVPDRDVDERHDWTTADKGEFDGDGPYIYNEITPGRAHRGRHLRQVLDAVAAGAGLREQLPDGNFGGCTFTDMTEIEVFGERGSVAAMRAGGSPPALPPPPWRYPRVVAARDDSTPPAKPKEARS